MLLQYIGKVGRWGDSKDDKSKNELILLLHGDIGALHTLGWAHNNNGDKPAGDE